MIEVRLLGPVTIELDGQAQDADRPLELALVARLALEPARVVASERLVDDLWGERLPRNPAASLHGLVYRLRRSLGDQGAVRRSGSGYVLDVKPANVDACRFDSLLVRARAVVGDGASQKRRAALQDALDLWRGPALGGLEVPFVPAQRARLEAAHLLALEERVEADLESGAHREVIGELEGLVRDHSDEERFWAQLMMALYRSGSQAAALRTFDRLRRHLREELGVNPSARICELERAILLQDPKLDLPSPAWRRESGSDRTKGEPDNSAGPLDARMPEPPESVKAISGGTAPAAQPRSDPDRAVADLIRAARRAPQTGKHPRRTNVLPLVGRDDQMVVLTRVVEATARDTEATFVVVVGEAGCGKTRLLDEFAAQVRAGGWLVVQTSAEDDDVLPYRPFAELVREVLASPLAATCLEEMGSLVTDLAWLVPSAPGRPAPQIADVGLARMRLFEAVAGLSQVAARQQPLVFVIDDAHRMGSGTAALLSLLLDRNSREDLTVVLGARDDEAPRSRGMGELLRRHDPIRVGVGPLTQDEVGELSARWPSEAEAPDPKALYSQTRGNPLLISALMTGQVRVPAGLEPVDIERLVAGRTRMLSPGVQEMLQVAALMGSDVSPELIANVTGADQRTVRRALDRVVDGGGLLDGGYSEGDYAWRHPLVRQAVIDSLDQPALRRFREAVGDAWAEQGHALRAARQAVEVLGLSVRRLLPVVLAGVDEALRTLAFELAEELCRQGLELAGRSGDPDLVVGLLNRLGCSLAYRALRHEATQAWEHAAQIARVARQADLMAEVALATEPYARSTVDFPLRWALLNEVLPALTTLDSSKQVRVISAWVNEGVLNHHATADAALCAQALSLARRLGDDTLVATALTATHNARRATQEVPVDISSELCQVAGRVGNPTWLAQAHLAALIDTVSLADTRAEVHFEEYLRAVDASPSPRSRWESGMVRSTWALFRGDQASSDRYAQTAVETGQRYGIEDADLAFAVHWFFRAFHDRTLDRLLGPLSKYADEHPDIPAWLAGAGLAMVAAGDMRGAGEMRDRVLPRVLASNVDPTWPVAACVSAQLCWETEAGPELTGPLLQALSTYPGRVAILGRFIGECGPVERYIGLLSEPNDADRAQRSLESALEVGERLGGRLWAERTRGDLDELLRRRGASANRASD